MRKILTSTALVVAVALGLGACGTSDDANSNTNSTNSTNGTGDTADATGRPSIVVTTSIAGDIVTSALGDLVGAELDVEVIVPVGADAHEFAPSAKQAETMENADLLVAIGLGYEEGMTDVIANALDAGAVGFALAGSLDEESGADPHVWLDPVRMVEALREFPSAVAEATGVAIDDIRSPVDRYIEELEALDTTIEAGFVAISPDRRNIVTNHDALGQFADRYGLTVIDTIIPSVSTSAEASAADLDEVLAAIRDNDVRAIFSETTASDQLARALADELGREVDVIELYTESLGEPGSGADTYVGLMTVNAARIAGTLA